MSSARELEAEARLAGRRLIEQDRELEESRARPASLPLKGTATFRLIPEGAVLYHLEGEPAWTTMRPGRYVALPDAIQALRDIAAHGGAWEARRATEGLGGWR